jgi:hypothetical protein
MVVLRSNDIVELSAYQVFERNISKVGESAGTPVYGMPSVASAMESVIGAAVKAYEKGMVKKTTAEKAPFFDDSDPNVQNASSAGAVIGNALGTFGNAKTFKGLVDSNGLIGYRGIMEAAAADQFMAFNEAVRSSLKLQMNKDGKSLLDVIEEQEASQGGAKGKTKLSFGSTSVFKAGQALMAKGLQTTVSGVEMQLVMNVPKDQPPISKEPSKITCWFLIAMFEAWSVASKGNHAAAELRYMNRSAINFTPILCGIGDRNDGWMIKFGLFGRDTNEHALYCWSELRLGLILHCHRMWLALREHDHKSGKKDAKKAGRKALGVAANMWYHRTVSFSARTLGEAEADVTACFEAEMESAIKRMGISPSASSTATGW